MLMPVPINTQPANLQSTNHATGVMPTGKRPNLNGAANAPGLPNAPSITTLLVLVLNKAYSVQCASLMIIVATASH